MNISKEKVIKFIDNVLPEVVEIRHNLHKCPEIGCKEFKTSALVRQYLNNKGIETLSPFMGTDVVAFLNKDNKTKNITLRADMDALPIDEATDIPYKSECKGMMHACGHDGHTAMLLGAAAVLKKFEDKLNGSVRFVFQPGEEILAAGKTLVDKGVLQNPKPDMALALHGWPGLREGVIASRHNVMYAAATHFIITIFGKGGHGSIPQNTIDPIVVGARIVESLQTIVSRNISPLESVVISICKFNAGTTANIIPEKAQIEGTTRYINPVFENTIPILMEQIIKGVCESAGAKYEFTYKIPYIPTVNKPDVVDFVRNTVEKWIGSENWHTLEKPSMGGEDFSYFLLQAPGAMANIGLGEKSANLHSPDFNFNDRVIKNGIIFFVANALEFLG